MDDVKAHTQVAQGSDRSFGVVFFIFFLAIGLWPVFGDNPVRMWALGVASAFLILALIFPRVLRPLNTVWFYFGLLLHKVVSPIVLGILFFGTVTPMGLLRRAFRNDPLRLQKGSKPSFWIDRPDPKIDPESLRRQF